MSHPFGDLVSQHLHRRHGLSQSKLAAGILQAPTIITAMCKGRRLTGPQARERVLAIIGWLHEQGALDTREEADALLNAAGMAALSRTRQDEAMLAQELKGISSENKRLASTVSIKHNLPAQTTSLIGRSQAIHAIKQLLGREAVRLITLVGPPGVGKTRLALHVAWDLRGSFEDGVWFVPLAVVNEPQYVAETICQALEIPDSGLSPQIALQKHLRNKRVLLVLDNFEQLLEKKDEADAALLVAGLLKIASELKVIITSREALNLNGEHLYSVPQLTTKSAVELFVERAQATHADFNTEDAEISNIAEICRRLDHLPLAIELAAARARLFTPAQLLSRLPNRLDLLIDGARDLPARQRTLRNTIEWSYNLLSPEEQRLFRRLGVFAGTCYLGAIKHITCANLQTSEEDLLQSLTVKSLIKVEPGEGE